MCGVYTHDVERVLRAAVNSGLVVEDEKGKIQTSKDGLRRSAHRDRLHPATLYGRWKFLMEADSEHRRHMSGQQQGLARLVHAFKRAQIPVAAGWRAVLNVPDLTQVAPDAMVKLEDSHVGSGWHHVEYERSANYRRRVDEKLAPYLKMYADGEPVRLLTICQNPRAEGVFWERAKLPNGESLPMITTTYKEATKRQAVGTPSVWRTYGQAT